MGRWLARFLKQENIEVTLAGRNLQKLEDAARELGCRSAPLEEAVKQAEAIIISVPIGNFEAVVRRMALHTRPGQYVFDITSVKQRPVEIMHTYLSGCRILGTHPMFGPGAASLQGQRFVFTPVGDAEESLTAQLRRLIESRGARVTVMSPARHDQLMGMVLGLPHFIALVSADTLLSLGSLKEAGEISGTSFRLLLTLAKAVLSEDPDFYSSLQMSLPDMASTEELFREKTDLWLKLVREHDGENFAQRMRYLREQFEREDPDFSSAYKNLYRLAD
ncbi:MAG: prephenate dehydrogenase/arogenate dehydrogenase family protein [Dehalococcoidia bacterium]|nr:prephenate dehydrogenase/arogenate dehydrogenase family protein [Dehalococcoidia bacterium]